MSLFRRRAGVAQLVERRIRNAFEKNGKRDETLTKLTSASRETTTRKSVSPQTGRQRLRAPSAASQRASARGKTSGADARVRTRQTVAMRAGTSTFYAMTAVSLPNWKNCPVDAFFLEIDRGWVAVPESRFPLLIAAGKKLLDVVSVG